MSEVSWVKRLGVYMGDREESMHECPEPFMDITHLAVMGKV